MVLVVIPQSIAIKVSRKYTNLRRQMLRSRERRPYPISKLKQNIANALSINGGYIDTHDIKEALYNDWIVKNYKVLPSDDICILEISQNSDIRIFENSLFDSFINNLTVINIYFPDFLPESKNYFQKISFEDTSFEIKRNYENIIINYKNGNFFYYLFLC